jgi:hypothetical protein
MVLCSAILFQGSNTIPKYFVELLAPQLLKSPVLIFVKKKQHRSFICYLKTKLLETPVRSDFARKGGSTVFLLLKAIHLRYGWFLSDGWLKNGDSSDFRKTVWVSYIKLVQSDFSHSSF